MGTWIFEKNDIARFLSSVNDDQELIAILQEMINSGEEEFLIEIPQKEPVSEQQRVMNAMACLQNAIDELSNIVPSGEKVMQKDQQTARETITFFLMDQIEIIKTYLFHMRTEIAREQKNG